jgi:arabinofuranan 3-O-arabinosyltransferase
MTTTVQAPGWAPQPGPTPSGASEAPRGRRLLFGFWAVVLVSFIAVSPGRMTFETKLGVALDPQRFLGDLGSLWNGNVGLGGIANQYIGYAFPALPYYAFMDFLQVPIWLAERLWLSIIVAVAFWGALRLAERLRVGTPATRLLGAVVYALWPTFTIVIGSTSAAALPGALLPWVLLPLTSAALSPRVAAARSALLIPFMGGVNAASTLAALLPVGLYLLRPAPARAAGLVDTGRRAGHRVVGGAAAPARRPRRELHAVRRAGRHHHRHHVRDRAAARRRQLGGLSELR